MGSGASRSRQRAKANKSGASSTSSKPNASDSAETRSDNSDVKDIGSTHSDRPTTPLTAAKRASKNSLMVMSVARELWSSVSHKVLRQQYNVFNMAKDIVAHNATSESGVASKEQMSAILGRVNGLIALDKVADKSDPDLLSAILKRSAAVREKYGVICPTPEAKRERLRTMRPFVLDNSLRETTVAQIYGHITEDKEAILSAIDGVGMPIIAVGAFGALERTEDKWLEARCAAGTIDKRWAVFSELIEWTAADVHAAELIVQYGSKLYTGNPVMPRSLEEYVPLGLRRAIELKISNIILESDFECAIWNSTFHTSGGVDHHVVLDHFDSVVRLARERLSQPCRIFFNIRDLLNCWTDEKGLQGLSRMFAFLEHAASRPVEERIDGILFEDSSGEVFPWDTTEAICAVRKAMSMHGWADGHLLCHIHKKYELAEATVLEILSAGATGIWCATAPAGAGWGHASSLVTLTNLARLGNPHIEEMYDMPALYRAAVVVTQRSTEKDPRSDAEVLGETACDVVFGEGGMGGSKFDLAKFLKRETQWRITTFTDSKMMANHLTSIFGEFDWPREITERMQQQLHADLVAGNKWQYQCAVCMFNLYQRCGGTEHLVNMAGTIKSSLEDMMAIPVFKDIRGMFESYDSNGQGNKLTYFDFYHGFLKRYTDHSRPLNDLNSGLAAEVFNLLDTECDGTISFPNIALRAAWTWQQWPLKCANLRTVEFLDMVFHRNIIPEASERLKIHSRQSLQTSSVQLERPQLFAILTSGFKVSQSYLSDMNLALQQNDVEIFMKEFSDYLRWARIHELMEESSPKLSKPRGAFSVFDHEFNAVITQTDLYRKNSEKKKLRSAVSDVFKSSKRSTRATVIEMCTGPCDEKLEALRNAFAKLMAFELELCSTKDTVVSECTDKLGLSGVDIRSLLQADILPQVIEDTDFQFWATHALQKLEKHQDVQQVRVFAHALIACGSRDQQNLWSEWLKDSLSTAVYESIEPFLSTPYIWSPFGTVHKERGSFVN